MDEGVYLFYDSGILSSGLNAMRRGTEGIFEDLMPSVMEIFYWLKMTAWAIVASVMAFHQRFPDPRMVKALVLFVVIGWLIQVFPTLSDQIFTAMLNAGAIVDPNMKFNLSDPGFIIFYGFKAVKPLLASVKEYMGPVAFFTNFIVIIYYMFAMLTVVLAFCALGIHLFFATVEFLILRVVAWFVLPFAVLSKTSFIASKGIGYVASAGLRVLALSLLAAASTSALVMFEQYRVSNISAALGLSTLACVLLILNIKAPAAAAALINCGPVLDGSSAFQALRVGMAGASAMPSYNSGAAKGGTGAAGAVGGAAGVVGAVKQVWNSATASFGGGQQGGSQQGGSQQGQSNQQTQGNYGPGSYQGGWSQGQQKSNGNP